MTEIFFAFCKYLKAVFLQVCPSKQTTTYLSNFGTLLGGTITQRKCTFSAHVRSLMKMKSNFFLDNKLK